MLSSFPFVEIVPLPPIWHPYLQSAERPPGFRGDACPGVACLPPAKAVRKLRVAADDGSVRQVMVFAEHGIERYLPFALFVDEFRRAHAAHSASAAAVSAPDDEQNAAGSKANSSAAAAAPSASDASNTLFFVPYIVQLPDTNASMRSRLHAALRDATLRSVKAHPPRHHHHRRRRQLTSPGSDTPPRTPPPPNHFVVVPRVCSCPSRAGTAGGHAQRARWCAANNAGLTAAEACARTSKEACEPFRDHPLLRRSVRVVAYEQLAAADRAGGGGGAGWRGGGGGGGGGMAIRAEQGRQSAPPRLPNLVMPYPSSIVGPVASSTPPTASAASMAASASHAAATRATSMTATTPLLLRTPWAWTLPAPPAPWDWTPRKPILVFAAMGALTNASKMSEAELAQRTAVACSVAERRKMVASPCAGRACRFAARLRLARQLHAHRHRADATGTSTSTSASTSAVERACLRQGNLLTGRGGGTSGNTGNGGGGGGGGGGLRCPEVLIAEFWLPHDTPHGVVGYDAHGKPIDPAKTARRRIPRGGDAPLFVDERSNGDVASLYRVMLASTFCLSLGGDTPTRKSTIDAIAAQCIPVLFSFGGDTMALDQLPFRRAIPYDQLVHVIPLEAIVDTTSSDSTARSTPASTPSAAATDDDVVRMLRAVPAAEVRAKRAALRWWGPRLQYAFGTSVGGGANAVQMVLRELASEVT